MRKHFCLAALALCAALLTGCEGGVSEMSSLTELSRPYLGEYVCERLLLAGEDVLPAFGELRLTLTPAGEACFSWTTKEGAAGTCRLPFEAQPDEGRLLLVRGNVRYACRLEEASVRLGTSLGGRYLYAQFAR